MADDLKKQAEAQPAKGATVPAKEGAK